MLLEFSVKNYKTFGEKTIFSLVPAPKQKDLEYSILKQKVGKKIYKGLCSSVIYGPNASGKSNILGAMDVFKSIVLRGNIQNLKDSASPNGALKKLELIPNNLDKSNTPIEMSIKFINKNLVFEYSFSFVVGGFLNKESKREILSEKLLVNSNMIFARDKGLAIGEFSVVAKYISKEFAHNLDQAKLIATNNLLRDELFLTNGFKNIFSSDLVSEITKWIAEQFVVLYQANNIKTLRNIPAPVKKMAYINPIMNKSAKLFGIYSNDIGYIFPDNGEVPTLCSLLEDKHLAIDAEKFESYGTIRFVNLFPHIYEAIVHGKTLVLDEFDASIHPMAIMSIINIFHNDEINKKGAQIIFNTHNPIFLNSNLFRRDEIKFVERDDYTHLSKIYSLSDFGTAGDKGVRKNEDYMNKYFISQYGAIKDIDFTPLFAEQIAKKEEA
jgi:AAA15 family ATPase/GTPase